MRDRPQLAFVAVVVLALLALLIAGLTNKSSEAFTLGVVAGGVAADLRPGDQACEERIDVPEKFSAVEVQVGTYRRSGVPLDVSIHRLTGDGAELASGSLPAGYPDVSRPHIEVGDVAEGERIAVCFENRGERKVALYGNAGRAAPASTLEVRGRNVDTDLTLVFHRSGERTLLAALPDAFRHAALFKAGWVGAWTFWLVAIAAIVLVPLALVRALRQARETSAR
jgi:hypothetical protein